MKHIFESCSTEEEGEDPGPPKKPLVTEIEVTTPSIETKEKQGSSLPKILTYTYECISNIDSYEQIETKLPRKSINDPVIRKICHKQLFLDGDIHISIDKNYINFVCKKIPENIKEPDKNEEENENSNKTEYKDYFELEDARRKKFGWKLHVSIDDEDTENLSKAWDIIADILLKYNIYAAKIVRPEEKFSCTEERSIERGNQITIYSYASPHVKWETVIKEITENLTKYKIKPGPKSQVNRQISGSNYVTYRNDANKDNESQVNRQISGSNYVTYRNDANKDNDGYDTSEPTGFNPHKHTNDPFENIKINVKDQPDIPAWKFDKNIIMEIK
jgi:hypothetical protein